MHKKSWFIGLLFVVQAVLLAGFSVYQVSQSPALFNSDILAILPKDDNRTLNTSFADAKLALEARSSKQLVFSSPNKAALHALKSKISWIDGIVATELGEFDFNALMAFYLNYPGSLMANDYPGLSLTDDTSAEFLMAELTRPDSVFATNTLAQDPTLALASFLQQVASFNGLNQEDGLLKAQAPDFPWLGARGVLAGSPIYIQSFEVQSSASDFAAIERLVETLKQVTSEISEAHGAPVFYSGFAFHSVENAANAKFEISTFGTISTVCLVLLMLVMFRSAMSIGLMLATVGNAILWGFAALLVFFDTIQLIALVFAVTLIGVAIDYLFHALCAKNKPQVNITTSLVLGFATTVAGYALFAYSPISLLAQVACFMIFGLLGALLFALFCYRKLPLTVTVRAIPWQEQLGFIAAQKPMVLMWAAGAVIFLFMIKPIINRDDVAALNATSAQLMQQEQLNLTLLGQLNTQHFIVQGDSMEHALQTLESITRWLKQNDDKAQLNGLQRFLPSTQQQTENLTLLNNNIAAGLYDSASQLLGLEYNQYQANVLTPEAFSTSPLASLLPLYQLGNKDGVQLWFSINDVSPRSVNMLLAEHKGTIIALDKRKEISLALTHYRETLGWLLLLASVIAVLVIAVRFGLASGLISAFLLLVVIMSALLVANLVQGALNLFNYLAVILILALAVDYLIFYRAEGVSQYNVQAVTLSMLSSCLVFGMLIFSSTPAVFSFGLTLVVGLVSLYVLAPCMVKEQK